MIERLIIRKAKERGHAEHGWLNSYHTFSFASYHNPEHMGFRSLRVINEDSVAPGKGFDTHAHRDMEIISYVIDGALEHKDSMGNGSVIHKGQVQSICAGQGIEHSEFNHSKEREVHFLQIWIKPNQNGLSPSYQELELDGIAAKQGLKLVGSPDGQEKSLTIHQDVLLYIGQMKASEQTIYPIRQGRGLWIQMIQGQMRVSGHALHSGDGMSIEGTDEVVLNAEQETDFLLFDLN